MEVLFDLLQLLLPQWQDSIYIAVFADYAASDDDDDPVRDLHYQPVSPSAEL